MLIAAPPGELVSVGELVIAGVGLLLAYPAYQIARAARGAQHTKAIAVAVATYLGIPIPSDPREAPPGPNENRPSIRDMLNDLAGDSAAQSAELAAIKEILRLHLSDHHGGPVDTYLFDIPRLPVSGRPRRRRT